MGMRATACRSAVVEDLVCGAGIELRSDVTVGIAHERLAEPCLGDPSMGEEDAPLAMGALETVGMLGEDLPELPSQLQVDSRAEGGSVVSLVHTMIAQQEPHLVGV